jgi:hypothetical protein
MKIHADHPMVQKNSNVAREMIKHAFSLGQNQDEHMYITKQYLNGILKPKEDDYSIRDTLKMWKKIVQNNLHGGKKLSDFDHDSVQKFIAQFPQLRKGIKKAGTSKELQPYHIGKIDHPEYGELDVYHIKQDEVKDEKEYNLFSKAMKTSCTIPGSTVCVQHSADYVKEYSKGHGFFAYLDREGTFRLGHGFKDRGIVRHNNSVLDGDEEADVSVQTEKLIKNPAHKVIYKLQSNNPDLFSVEDKEIEENITHPHILKYALKTEENQKKYLKPKIFKDILFSNNHSELKLRALRAGLNLSDEHDAIIKDPKLIDRLIDQGQSHILFHVHPSYGENHPFITGDLKNKLGLVKPEDYKKRVMERFMSWSPKKEEKLFLTVDNPDNDYEEERVISHPREEDIRSLLFGRREDFNKDDLESMLFHPNFGHQHGKIVSEIFHNSTVRGFDKDKFEPHIQKMIESDSPHMHLYVLNRPEQWVHDKITPEHVKNMITNADELQEKFKTTMGGDYPLASQIAYKFLTSKKARNELTKRSSLQDNENVEHDDTISAIFKSKSIPAMVGYVDAVDSGAKTLSTSEIDALVNSKEPRLMRYASQNYKKLSPESRKTLLKAEPDDAYHAVVEMKDIKPDEIETFWDNASEYDKKFRSKKPDHTLVSQNKGAEAMINLLRGHSTYWNRPEFISHLELTEKIKQQALEHDNPSVVRSALKHISNPEQIDKIIDKFTIDHDGRRGNHDVIHLLHDIAHNTNENPHLKSRHIEKIIEKDGFDLFGTDSLKNILTSPVLSSDYLNKLYKNLNYDIDRDNPNMLPEDHPHRKLRFSPQKEFIARNIIQNPNINDDTINDILKNSRNRKNEILNNNNFGGRYRTLDLNDLYEKTLIPLSRNPNLKDEHLKELIDQSVKFHPYTLPHHGSIFANIAANKNINNEHVKNILKATIPPVFPKGADEKLEIKNWEASGKNTFSDAFYKNLFSNDSFKENLDHETFKELIQSAGFETGSETHSPGNFKVRDMFKSIGESKKITKDNITEMMEQTRYHPNLQLHLLSHENATPEHLSQFLDHHQERIKNFNMFKSEDGQFKNISKIIFGQPEGSFTEKVMSVTIEKDKLDKVKKIVTPEHIQKLFELNPDAFSDEILGSEKSSDEHKEYFLKKYEEESEFLKSRIKQDKNSRIVDSLNNKSNYPRMLLKDPNLDTKFVDRIHNTTFPTENGGVILRTTLSHPNLSPQLLEKQLHHKNDSDILSAAIIGASNKNLKSSEELSQLVADHLEREDMTLTKKQNFLNRMHVARGNGEYDTQIIKPSHYEIISKLHQPELKNFGIGIHSDMIFDPTLDDKFHAEIQNNPNISDEYKRDFKLIREKQNLIRTAASYNPS